MTICEEVDEKHSVHEEDGKISVRTKKKGSSFVIVIVIIISISMFVSKLCGLGVDGGSEKKMLS